MKKLLLSIAIKLSLSISLISQSDFSKSELDAYIRNTIEQTDATFDWSDASVDQLWTSLTTHDSIVAIGYKPVDINNVKPYLKL